MRRFLFVLAVGVIGTAAALLGPLPSSRGAGKPRELTVAAGTHDRRDAVVSFALPDARPGGYRLLAKGGDQAALQVDDRGQAWFVLRELKAGESRTYRIEEKPGTSSTGTAVTAARDDDRIKVAWEGRPVLGYQGGPGRLPSADVDPVFRRGGYIHPVLTPSGRVVSDDYPPDHLHHHGIWFAWTSTEFQGRKPDFWNMGQKKATVEFDSWGETWDGAVHAGLRARHRYVDLGGPAPVTVLKESWEARVYAAGRAARPYHLFDLDVSQTNETDAPLVLPEYHYGGVGFRGARGWLGPEAARFLTSEGKDRSNGHATRGRWCHISGRVDGEWAGIAVLDHPGNFRAPQPMRIHPTEPFFCYAPSQLGRWEITRAAPYVSRYRFAAFDGPADPAELNRLWTDYAEPPAVSLK